MLQFPLAPAQILDLNQTQLALAWP